MIRIQVKGIALCAGLLFALSAFAQTSFAGDDEDKDNDNDVITIVGPQGPVGPAGATGATGATGAQGPIGLTGAAGADGATGAQGPVGLTGAAGADGATGAQGPIGLTGTAGADGATGAQGPVGPAGTQGPAGLAGANGTNGTNGIDGAQGPIGLMGPVGPQGPTGSQGAAGTNGTNGTNGVDGAQGPIGLTGPAGPADPAVQDALCNLYSLTGQPSPAFCSCFAFDNTTAEDLTNNTYFDKCVAATGNTVRITVRDAGGLIVYQATGSKVGTWTNNQITSTVTPTSQYLRFNHNRKILLDNGDELTISGQNSANAGCGGDLGNGYVIIVATPGGQYYQNLKLLVAPYKRQTSNVGSLRSFIFGGTWTSAGEISFNGGGVMSSCAPGLGGGTPLTPFIGRVEITVLP